MVSDPPSSSISASTDSTSGILSTSLSSLAIASLAISIERSLGNLAAKFEAFNWECDEIMDGHAFDQLVPALEKTGTLSKPRALIVHTIKGRGIRAFENDPAWHARKIKGEDLEIGRRELGLT